MSTISTDERREVARRLREAASYYETMERDVDFYPVESALGLKPAGETAYAPESVRSLADLIEPEPERTCRNLSDNGWFTCSECGAYGAAYGSSYVDGDGKRWYTTANPPQLNYCPSCGAKVVYVLNMSRLNGTCPDSFNGKR